MLQAVTQGWGGDARALAFLQDRAVTASVSLVRLVASGDCARVVWARGCAGLPAGPGGGRSSLVRACRGTPGHRGGMGRCCRGPGLPAGPAGTIDPDPSIRGAARQAIAQGWNIGAEALAFGPDPAADEALGRHPHVRMLADPPGSSDFPANSVEVIVDPETLFYLAVQRWGHDAERWPSCGIWPSTPGPVDTDAALLVRRAMAAETPCWIKVRSPGRMCVSWRFRRCRAGRQGSLPAGDQVGAGFA